MNFSEQIRHLKAEHPTWGRRKIAAHIGIHPSRVGRMLERDKKSVPEAVIENPEGVSLESDNKSSILTVKSFTVRTVEDALEKGEVDTAIWAVDRFVLNSWEVGCKTDNGIVTKQLWQVKVWLKRLVTQAVEIASNALWARMKKEAPRIPWLKYKRNSDPHLLEISPFDAHFGKLAWAAETGEDYDLKIAEKRFVDSFEKILSHAKHRSVEKILLPLGNDFVHIDNNLNTTANGTPQDVDGRYPKIIETASMAFVRAIERCRTVAPVDVLFVPGNHDTKAAWHVCEFIRAWFRRTNGVWVDSSPTSRKYFAYGVTLLGFTHGNEEAHRDLPLIMAGEEPQLWAASRFREIHLGHFHKAKQTQYSAGDTFGPVIVRVLPSISGTDLFHYKKGYVKCTRGAEGFLYSRSEGMVSTLFAAV
jgi:hypothetical protein